MNKVNHYLKSFWALPLLLMVSCSLSLNEGRMEQKTSGTISGTAAAAISPAAMVGLMGSGINLGNTLDATPTEGSWTGGVLAQSYYFDDYVKAGFKHVRIPVTWEDHFLSDNTTVDPVWMARVKTVVDWGLSRGLIVILNTHHEDWLMTDYNNQIGKFQNLWSQIATYFASESPNLVFEILNEPNTPMVMAQVNDMDSRILPIIRQTNPTRNVMIGPDQQMSAYELMNNAGLTVPNDPYVIVEFHYYNPWPFCGNGTGTWGSTADYSSMNNDFASLASWSSTHKVPLYMGEYGTVTSGDYNSRINWFKNIAGLCQQKGFAYAVWDDSGSFAIYNRSARTFDNTVLSAIIPAGQTAVPPTPVPGMIQAESYSAMSGIQTEACSDTGGGLDVGWIDSGDWMNYTVSVASSGTYSVDFRVATINSGDTFNLQNGSTVLCTVTVPNTGGWQTWTTVTKSVTLSAGVQTLTFLANSTGMNINYMNFYTVASSSSVISSSSSSSSKSSVSSVVSSSSSSAPISSSSSSSSSSAPKSSSSAASSTASASPITLNSWQCNANSGGLTIWTGGVGGWDPGEWIQFNNVNLGTGYKTMSFNYAATAGGSYDVRLDSVTATPDYGTFNFNSTGGWNTYQTVNCNLDTTKTGTHTLFIRCNTGAANIGVLKLFN